MAMLAGPRRKQKVINLRAKNNEWSNDSTKFGQRMLEKMGWTSGKGLGAKENGIVDHVVARYKNDDKGLGYEDKNDQWTKHEDDFNALLANLSNGSENTEILHSGKSLEDKSKKSKARIHYHKFTRGKDMSRYSEKDLANIFGKKTFKEPIPIAEIQKEETKTTEQVFTEKGSMEDYFKNKLAAIKSKNRMNVSNVQENEDDEADYGFQGFSQGNDDVEDSEITHNGFGYMQYNVDDSNSNCDFVKAKKTKSKDKDTTQHIDTAETSIDECPTYIVNELENVDKNIEYKQQKSKKKKKSKNKDDNIDNCTIEGLKENQYSEHNELVIEEISLKKKKKTKTKNTNIDLSQDTHLNTNISNEHPKEFHCDTSDNIKKKKKTKNVSNIVENECQNNIQEECISKINKSNRKKKKNMNDEDTNEIDAKINIPKKKKKSKN